MYNQFGKFIQSRARRGNRMKLQELEKEIGYVFQNKELLKTALTHSSYAYEHHEQSNEKLEFLGDSILEFISSKYLYNHYPELAEGKLTKLRADIVCEKSLYKIAKKHHFEKYLFVGKSESQNHGNTRPTIMADSVEALIAAIYFDSGLEEAEKFIIANLEEEAKIASQNVGQKDYKTVLQEKLQEKGEVHIEYTIIKEEGPDHDKKFTAEVKCNGKKLAQGEGKTKKAAEMEAARKAMNEK